MPEEEYDFADLPVPPIRAGTSVLLAGPTHAGTRQLAFRLLAGGDDEGSIVITTNSRAERVIEDCRTAGVTVDPDRTAVVDCVGDDEDLPARVVGVSGPADLTGIGMRYSKLYQTFHEAGLDRVRTGICSVTTLLSFNDLRTVSRFVHTMVGRIDSVDGFGVFLIDPGTQDERTVSTVGQFCGARIEVREGDAGPELRTRGLATGNDGWTPFDPLPERS
ncbi:DUF7504 family protein [Haloplanus ruber]|uniref:Recombinase RecA n=1 Tax=Haloplanus ruber TaxID=869892 RepID=A0ABD6CW31_9EURY|nr:hypothetical protein [Haloplanus ruber]